MAYLTLLLSVGGAKADAEDWTGWRGPQRDGQVEGFRTPEVWPKKLNRRWQIEVGEGHASPVVVGARIYLHTRQDQEEVVRGINLDNGQVLWERRFTVEFQPAAGAGRHGNSPKATPSVVDGRLFTLSIDGEIRAWDAQRGDALWSRASSPRFDPPAPLWGAAMSPLVDNGLVFIHFGGDQQGALEALEVETGRLSWTYGEAGPAYASPIIAEIGGHHQLVAQSEQAVLGLEPETGRLLWRFAFPQTYSLQNSVTPLVWQDLVVLAGEDRGVFALEPKREGERWSVTKRWHMERYSPDMSSPVLVGAQVCALAYEGKGRLFCVDPATGELERQGPRRTGYYAALLATPEWLVVQTDDARLWFVSAKEKKRLEVVASYPVASSPTWAHPVLFEDSILVKDSTSLVLWSFGASE